MTRAITGAQAIEWGATQAILSAAEDLKCEVLEAETSDRALHLARRLNELIEVLLDVSSLAHRRTDELCGGAS